MLERQTIEGELAQVVKNCVSRWGIKTRENSSVSHHFSIGRWRGGKDSEGEERRKREGGRVKTPIFYKWLCVRVALLSGTLSNDGGDAKNDA